MKRGRAKNNNLVKHREVLQKRNKALVEKAIAHIRELGGEVTMSMVSRVTYEIADIQSGEKGITLAGISKNETYRALVEQAKANSEIHQSTAISRAKHLSDGDIRMMLHALRVENIELKRDNKILTQQIKEMPNVIETVEPIEDALIREHNAIKNTARSMVIRLCELELAYIDADIQSLKVAHYEEMIVPYEALKLFYSKELHDIQCKVRENASND